MPRSGGPSSLAHRFIDVALLELTDQEVVDLRDDARDQHVVERPGPVRVDPELLEERAGRRRHHEHAVGEEHRLADVVGGEQERRAAGALDALALDDVLEPLAGERVERAERFVAQQDRRVARQRAGEGRPLAHPGRQLVRLPIGRPVDLHPREPRRALAPHARPAGRPRAGARGRCSPAPRATGTAPAPGRGRRGRGPGRSRAGRRRAPRRASGARARRSRASVEVFPQPLGPIRQTNSPRSTSNVRCSKAGICSPDGRVRVIPRSRTEMIDGGRGAGGVVPGLGRGSAHRSRNFSAISICTTLPSCTTRTTVPYLILPKDPATFARTRRSSSVRSSPSIGSSCVEGGVVSVVGHGSHPRTTAVRTRCGGNVTSRAPRGRGD